MTLLQPSAVSSLPFANSCWTTQYTWQKWTVINPRQIFKLIVSLVLIRWVRDLIIGEEHFHLLELLKLTLLPSTCRNAKLEWNQPWGQQQSANQIAGYQMYLKKPAVSQHKALYNNIMYSGLGSFTRFMALNVWVSFCDKACGFTSCPISNLTSHLMPNHLKHSLG